MFIVEAFEDYWKHLTDADYRTLKLYDDPALSRTLSIVVEMFNRLGMDDIGALHHTITLLSPVTSPPTPLMLVRHGLKKPGS